MTTAEQRETPVQICPAHQEIFDHTLQTSSTGDGMFGVNLMDTDFLLCPDDCIGPMTRTLTRTYFFGLYSRTVQVEECPHMSQSDR
jgi:hypothetical protein